MTTTAFSILCDIEHQVSVRSEEMDRAGYTEDEIDRECDAMFERLYDEAVARHDVTSRRVLGN